MSTHDSLGVFDHSSDATFRVWIIKIHTMLTDIGLVQTSDTGQVNTATVTKSGSTNTDAGFSVWRFNDTLQATVPIFIRFNFGNGDSTSRPRITFEVGAATNGSGTLSGLGSGTSYAITSNLNSLPTAFRCLGAGDGSGFWIAPWYDNTNGNHRPFVCIDRFRNDDGTPNADGFTVVYRAGSATSSTTLINNRATSTVSTLSFFPSLIPFPVATYMSTLTVDGELVTYPGWVCTPRPRGIKMIRTLNYADMPSLQLFTTATFGATRTFIPFGGYSVYWDVQARGNVSAACWWAD